jgi:hypothetical protein
MSQSQQVRAARAMLYFAGLSVRHHVREFPSAANARPDNFWLPGLPRLENVRAPGETRVHLARERSPKRGCESAPEYHAIKRYE